MASLVRATGVEIQTGRHIHKAEDTEFSQKISFNEKGFCTCHPDIQLRKKTLIGTWETLMETCPRCDEEFKLSMERKRMENMKLAEEYGIAREPAVDKEYPLAMVNWVDDLGFLESDAAKLIAFLCGDTMGMSSPRDFLDLERQHIELALAQIPVAKKKTFEKAVESVKEDVLAAAPTMAQVVDVAAAAAEPAVLERSNSPFIPGWRQRPADEAAEYAAEKAREAASESVDVAAHARKLAAKWFGGTKRLTLRDGSYKGRVSDGRRHGEGIMKYDQTNLKYEGEWENDLWHGHGVLTVTGGPVYEGEFEKGKNSNGA